MTFTSSAAEPAAATDIASRERNSQFAGVGHEPLIRSVLFLATILYSWFTASPFPDLSDPKLLEATSSGNLLSQVLTLLLIVALAIYAFYKPTPLVLRALTLPLILLFVAFGISDVLSLYPGIALRRTLLTALIIFQAALLLLLPLNREHFARLLTTAGLVVLAACYLGVIFLPHLSIHQASDVAEPVLAGDWRGFFMHKNGAGASMVLLIFIGIFVCRVWSGFAGAALIVPAAIFLHFTHAKSPANLLPVVLALSFLLPRLRNPAALAAAVLSVPILINLLTVGSVVFEPIRTFITSFMSDPTFTGRNEIWRFSLDHVAQRPLLGYGFEAFWGMPDLVASWTYLESWGYRASDAHNGYLNLAVTTGLVGLALALWWIIVQPLADLRRLPLSPADRPLAILFLQVWMFGLALGGFESVFFTGGSAVWLLTAVSIIGLRFQTLTTSGA